MTGGGAVVAAMAALRAVGCPVPVVGLVAAAENSVSGNAMRPGDVIRHWGGRTTEVTNTDAEGRLVLADALAYLSEKRPRALIDTATLTGACMIALGDRVTGAMGNDDALIGDVIAAGEATGEPIWELPMFPDYRRLIDSPVADVKNIGERYGGAITAAWFLAEFVGDTPWVHLDIAGPAWSEKGNDLGPKGATGAPVRALVRYLLDQAA
jgi:leucyl aminopeptidase